MKHPSRVRQALWRVYSQLCLSVCVLLCAVLSSGCRPGGPSSLRYDTAVVTRGELMRYVNASGSLSAVVSVDVGSQVSGKVAVVYVDFNSSVKKGQLVAEIDPTLYAAALRQAQGDLASAEAEVTLKHQNLQRKRILVPLRAASQLDLDQANAEVAQAEATAMIKGAAVQSAKASLEYCKITAPVDGIVISRKIDAGQTVIAAMATPLLFTIAQDITKMNITADVSEADIGQVRPQQLVDFTVDAFPDEVFRGTVSQVRKSPVTTQNVVTYQTIVAVANPDQRLFPGMTANVSILVAARHDALKAPNAALRFIPPSSAVLDLAPPKALARNKQLVYTLVAGGAKLHPLFIRTGITDGMDTEIVEGLAPGLAVVTAALTPDSRDLGEPP
jgi:HlyD family secretion protein